MRLLLRIAAYLSTHHPLLVLGGMLALAIAASFPARKAINSIETDLTNLLPKDMPASSALYEYREHFETADLMFVTVDVAPCPPPAQPRPEDRYSEDPPGLPEVPADICDVAPELYEACGRYHALYARYLETRRAHPEPFDPTQSDTDSERAAADAWYRLQRQWGVICQARRTVATALVDRIVEELEKKVGPPEATDNQPAGLLHSVSSQVSPDTRTKLLEHIQQWGLLYLDPQDIEGLVERLAPENLRQSIVDARARYMMDTSIVDLVRRDPIGLFDLFMARTSRYRRPIEGGLSSDRYVVSPDKLMYLITVRGHYNAGRLDYTRAVMAGVDDAVGRAWERLEEEAPREYQLAQWVLPTPAGAGPAEGEGGPEETGLSRIDHLPMLRVGYAGGYPVIMHEDASLRQDVINTFTLSFVMVMLVFMFMYRRFTVIFFLSIPVLMGAAFTLALAGLTLERISIISGSFAAMLVGVGVDYGIHIYNRYAMERAHGMRAREAVRHALLSTGTGIVTGALTTSAGFYGIMVSDFEALADFGFLAGTGILLLMLTILLVMPALLVLFSGQGSKPMKYRRMSSFGLPFVARFVAHAPAPIVAVTLVLFGVSIAYTGARVHDDFFDANLSELSSSTNTAFDQTMRLMEKFGTNLRFIVVTSRSPSRQTALEDAREVWEATQERLISRGLIADMETVLQFVPAVSSQNASRQDMAEALTRQRIRHVRQTLSLARRMLPAAPQWDRQRARSYVASHLQGLGPTIEAFKELTVPVWGPGRGVAFFKPFIESLERMDQLMHSQQCVQLEDLPESPAIEALLRSYVATRPGPDGEPLHLIATRLYPMAFNIRQEGYERIAYELGIPTGQVVGPSGPPRSVTALPMAGLELRDRVQDESLMMSLLVLSLVSIIMVLGLRSTTHNLFKDAGIGLGRGALALAPLIIGIAWMLALMLLVGWKFNPVNIVVLPAIIGIGIDHGIHIVHAHVEGRGVHHMIAGIGRALVGTSLTTIVGFGSLLAAHDRGLATLGQVAVVGFFCTTLASMVALPAFLVRFLPPAQDRKAAEATSPEEADVALQEAIDEA